MGKTPLSKRTKKQAKYYLHLHRQAKKKEVAANIAKAGLKAAEQTSQNCSNAPSEDVNETATVAVKSALHNPVGSQDHRDVHPAAKADEILFRDVDGPSLHAGCLSLLTHPAGVEDNQYRSEDEISIFAPDDI